jgi:DNA processing protein
LRKAGIQLVTFDNQYYPELLRQINNPPPLLYLLGNSRLLSRPSVAIVGSRAATSYGKRVASLLARGLVENGVTVVSGMALGIDGAAHRGALDGSGATVGVLGCGLDVIYPRQHETLYREIRKQGLLISEYPVGTRPDGFRFPARNRIIAGLCLGVVVVEAAARSGSLITAGLALEEGREVFAVPGQVDSFKSKGTHWLLQQGAKLVQSVDDILEELAGVLGPLHPGDVAETAACSISDDGGGELLRHIDVYPMARDELIRCCGLDAGRVAELLLFLELEGLVEILPGNRVRSLQK